MQQREYEAESLSILHPLRRAKVALSLGEREEALQQWQEACTRYPTQTKASHDSLDILLGLERFDEAEALMLERRRLAPGDRFYSEGYAIVAEHRRDWPEAIWRWTATLRKFPTPVGYAHMASCLRAAGRINEVEKVLRSAVSSYPYAINLWTGYATAAETLCNWLTGLERWETVSGRFKHPSGPVGEARCLAALGRLDEAETRLTAARTRHPLEPNIPITLARLAEQRNDATEAARRWTVVRQRFPLIRIGYTDEARVLRAAQRLDEAEMVIREATERFPREAWAFIEYATLANLRQDWKEAVRRWGTVRQRWPDRREGYVRGAQALDALGQKAEATQLRAMQAEPKVTPTSASFTDSSTPGT